MCGGPFCGFFWPLAYGVNNSPESERNTGPSESAIEILKRRYVNGEISKQEFEEKKKDLR